jgi:predicted nucleotidyltransferase
MKKEEIIGFLRTHKQEMYERFGVVKIGLFGSYVRDEAREDSDIDIAVELTGDRLFRKFFALESFLTSGLNKKVDLGVESALKPLVRERISKEINYV